MIEVLKEIFNSIKLMLINSYKTSINIIKSISIFNVLFYVVVSILIYGFVLLTKATFKRIEERNLEVYELIKKDTITQKQKVELWYVAGFKDTLDIRIPIKNEINLYHTYRNQPYLLIESEMGHYSKVYKNIVNYKILKSNEKR